MDEVEANIAADLIEFTAVLNQSLQEQILVAEFARIRIQPRLNLEGSNL